MYMMWKSGRYVQEGWDRYLLIRIRNLKVREKFGSWAYPSCGGNVWRLFADTRGKPMSYGVFKRTIYPEEDFETVDPRHE